MWRCSSLEAQPRTKLRFFGRTPRLLSKLPSQPLSISVLGPICYHLRGWGLQSPHGQATIAHPCPPTALAQTHQLRPHSCPLPGCTLCSFGACLQTPLRPLSFPLTTWLTVMHSLGLSLDAIFSRRPSARLPHQSPDHTALPGRPEHPEVRYITFSSVSPAASSVPGT